MPHQPRNRPHPVASLKQKTLSLFPWNKEEKKLTQLLAIRCVDTSAVQNLDIVRDSRRDSRRKVGPHISMCFLSLTSSGNFSCADGPHGLVRDDDLAVYIILATAQTQFLSHKPPVSLFQNLYDGLELGFADFLCLTGFTFLESFANA